MKTRFPFPTCALATALLAAGCQTAPQKDSAPILFGIVHAHPDQKEAAALFAELGGEEGFFQTVHYLYRWYLDENDFQRRDLAFQRQLWLRRLQVVKDENDNSRFMEVVFPALGVTVTLKKTDYRIPELKLDVKSGGYRVVRISRETRSAAEAEEYLRLEFDPGLLFQRLFQERLQAQFPSDELLERMKASVAKQVAELNLPVSPRRENTVYFAPVHAVSNEIWAYWEEGKLLFHFTSDIDLSNPAVWSRETLGVSIYDIVEQTVVSHEERPGDGRFLTRDQVGRALYNCLALGRKSLIPAKQERQD
jgi:hypothetical protein